MSRRSRKGFTLIELLIVVAIIAILAAIAVPNFLEAQVRAKVSRCKNDTRSLAVALEAYYVDWNSYTHRASAREGDSFHGWVQLTTPVAYITSIPRDPFGEVKAGQFRLRSIYELGAGAVGIGPAGLPANPGKGFPSNTWLISGFGPDKTDDVVSASLFPGHRWSWNDADYPWLNIPANDPAAISEALSLLYDPTNGTISAGNILRFGGMKPPGRMFDLFYSLSSAK